MHAFKRTVSIALATVLVSASLAFAQQGPTIVQQSPSLLHAATRVDTSATSAATITIPAVGGEYIYIYEVDISSCAGAAVTGAAPTSITTTNIAGSPAWTVGSSSTAGICGQVLNVQYPNGLRAATPGTAVTFVLPTFATNQTVRVNVASRTAP